MAVELPQGLRGPLLLLVPLRRQARRGLALRKERLDVLAPSGLDEALPVRVEVRLLLVGQGRHRHGESLLYAAGGGDRAGGGPDEGLLGEQQRARRCSCGCQSMMALVGSWLDRRESIVLVQEGVCMYDFLYGMVLRPSRNRSAPGGTPLN